MIGVPIPSIGGAGPTSAPVAPAAGLTTSAASIVAAPTNVRTRKRPFLASGSSSAAPSDATNSAPPSSFQLPSYKRATVVTNPSFVNQNAANIVYVRYTADTFDRKWLESTAATKPPPLNTFFTPIHLESYFTALEIAAYDSPSLSLARLDSLAMDRMPPLASAPGSNGPTAFPPPACRDAMREYWIAKRAAQGGRPLVAELAPVPLEGQEGTEDTPFFSRESEVDVWRQSTHVEPPLELEVAEAADALARNVNVMAGLTSCVVQREVCKLHADFLSVYELAWARHMANGAPPAADPDVERSHLGEPLAHKEEARLLGWLSAINAATPAATTSTR